MSKEYMIATAEGMKSYAAKSREEAIGKAQDDGYDVLSVEELADLDEDQDEEELYTAEER